MTTSRQATDPLFALEGRTILVTGASSGLGAHFSSVLGARGARLVLAARRMERLDEVADAITAAGGVKPLLLAMDVGDEASVAEGFAQLDRQDVRLDVVINNAGIAADAPALTTPLAAFDQVMDTNLRGTWLVSTQAARRWQASGDPGTIVNIASILGLRVGGNVAAYAASKAAVVQLTKALALEWARHNIRVNALAPGYIATEINNGFFGTDAGMAMIKRIPMRRLGQASDLDGALLLLCSDASRFMTGSVLTVDGGHLVSSL